MSDISDPVPRSIRDAFHKILNNPALDGKDLILAETVTQQADFVRFYKNLLAFEVHLAQITELILLFCESEGSFTELGAFAVTDEIARRLLVVLRDTYWNEPSFIKYGPIQLLLDDYPNSVFVVDDLDIGIDANSPAKINLNILRDRLQEPLLVRLARSREPTTFNPQRDGHLIKLIVAFIQDYGGLTLEEIREILRTHELDIELNKIQGYLLCAESVEWIRPLRKGLSVIYFAKQLDDAANFFVRRGAEKNKGRRRALIRQYWKTNDPPRYRGIGEVSGMPL